MPPAPLSCKCCGGASPWFGAADFNKSCEDRAGPYFHPPAAGRLSPLRRLRLPVQSFPGRLAADARAGRDLQRRLHQGRSGPRIRAPRSSGHDIEILFGQARAELRVLDFGGGTGELARRLRARGFGRVDSIDPFHGVDQVRLSRVDLMLCFEVVEHLPTPDLAFAAAPPASRTTARCSSAPRCSPRTSQRSRRVVYLAPRNGHVSLHTRRSLEILTRRHGLTLGSMDEGFHLAWRGTPAFAARILPRLR